MSPALRLLLSLASCALLRGTPLPPREVRLWAQNFHVQLRWEPDPHAPNGTAYQVEWRKRTSRWTRADTCRENSTGSSWACELHCDDIHGIYWARVRAVQDGEPSPWVSSSELLPYRDTIVGPPALSWQLQGHNLSINLSAPLTPYKSMHGSYKPLSKVLRKLRYHLRLYHGDVLQQEVPCRWTTKKASCTFRFLMPSTQYCIRTVAVGIAPQQSLEAEQCLVTPAGPAGFPWVLLAALIAALPLLSVPAVCLTCVYVFPKSSEMHLPKMLALLPSSTAVPTLELQEDAPAPLLPAPREHPAPTAPLLPGEWCYQERSGYCPNGFGMEWHEGRTAPSSQPSSWVPAPEDDEEDESDGDAAAVSSASSVMDGDYGTSETWLSPHLQLYSTALGAGSSLLPALHTISFSPGELQEDAAGSWVPLSSVRLPGTELGVDDSSTQQRGCPCMLPMWHVGTPHEQEAAAPPEHPFALLGAPEAECEE
uniref:Fibronectin type-III domain-containing protein n=1 Tax=Chrysolophus pictus TaxID=9089 RepID=A0A8C3LUN7_CHRPC